MAAFSRLSQAPTMFATSSIDRRTNKLCVYDLSLLSYDVVSLGGVCMWVHTCIWVCGCKHVCLRLCKCVVCVRGGFMVCVCVCVWERERECAVCLWCACGVCVWEKERECVWCLWCKSVCVCVREKERERESVWCVCGRRFMTVRHRTMRVETKATYSHFETGPLRCSLRTCNLWVKITITKFLCPIESYSTTIRDR